MMWRTYKNEIMVGVSLLLMVIAFIYKEGQISKQAETAKHITTSLEELKEVIALKKVWKDKNLSKKVERLKGVVAPSKMTWRRDGKKLTASYKALTPRELNTLISKIMSLAVEIEKLELHKTGETYEVELKCKW